MTATVILYIGFCFIIVWKRLLKWSGKPGKLGEFHFAKFVSTLLYPADSKRLSQPSIISAVCLRCCDCVSGGQF